MRRALGSLVVAVLLAGCLAAGYASLLPAALASGSLAPYFSLAGASARTHLLHAFVALLFISGVTGTGLFALRRAELRAHNRLEETCLGFALGCGAWTALAFALGIARLYDLRLLRTLGAGGVAFGLWALTRPSPVSIHGPEKLSNKLDTKIYGGLVFCLAVLLLPHALIPETFYDALEYHIGLPHLYLLQGGLTATPDNAFAGVPSMPMLASLWALLADKWGVTAHLLNWSLVVWTAAAMGGLGLTLGAPAAGLAAAALFFSFPIVAAAGFLTTVELWWTFNLLMALSSVLAALRLERADPSRRRWLIVAGLLLGCAMATKYLAWAAPTGMLAVYFMNRDEKKFMPGEAFVIFLGAATVLLPWVVKNIAHYGNPVYPFIHEKLVPGADIFPGWRYLGVGATLPFDRGVGAYANELLLTPWRAAFYQANIAQSFGPGVLMLVPLLLLSRPAGEARIVRWFAVGCWLPFLFVVQMPRYLIPCAGLLCLAACLGAWQELNRAARAAIAVSVALSLIIVWGLVLPKTHLDAFSGKVTFADFLSRGDRKLYPPPSFPAARYISEQTPATSKVLVFGDARGFHVPRAHLVSTPMQTSALERFANASSSADDLRARFAAEGIDYVLVNYAEILRNAQPFRFTAGGKNNLDEFWRRYALKSFESGPNIVPAEGGKAFVDRWVAVYRLLPAGEAVPPQEADDLIANIMAGPRPAKSARINP